MSNIPDGAPPPVNGSIGPLYPLLRYFYCCVLRILEIRLRGHLKARAVKNVIEFFDWCEAMRCHVPLAFQAALALFGGSKEAQTLVNIKTGKTPLDAAWRAAWDIWHSWMTQNYFAVVPVDGVLLHPIFVTGDRAAAYVAGRCIPRVVFQNRGEPFLSVSEVDPHFPYYADDLERLDDLLRSRAVAGHARAARDAAYRLDLDQDRIAAEVERLERAVMAGWRPWLAETPTTWLR